jgi:uncharacterized protein (TIGR03435 family)
MQEIGKLVLITAAFAFPVIPLLSQTTAQTPASKKPSFEVNSVKTFTPTAQAGFRGGGPRGNSFSMTGPLRMLLQTAYARTAGTSPGVQLQIVGAPGWVDSDLFEVQAKADCIGGPIPREEMQLMVQSLLEERFQLKAHYETRELPIYNLVVVKEGKLKLSEDQTAITLQPGAVQLCGPVPAALQVPLGQRGLPFDPSKPGTMPRGAMIMMMNPTTGLTMTATAMPIGNLVGMLQNQAGRPIIDKTGLKGLFDIQLRFSPEGLANPFLGGGGGIVPPPPGAAIGPVPGGSAGTAPNVATEPVPSLFTAVQEQLGLKLESARGPVEVLVIDSVQKPTEN